MPNVCCVPGCPSNSSYKRGDNYVPAFSFPKSEARRELWRRNIPRSLTTITKSTVVCMYHFEEKFLIKEIRATRPDGTLIVLPRKNITLTNDAYPTIFPNTDDVYDIASKYSKKYSKKEDPRKIEKKICELDTENSIPYICTGRDTVIPFVCCVPNCRSNCSDGRKVTLFPFPKDQETLEKWLRVIKIENFKPTDAMRVCELHFQDIDIERIRTFTVPTTGELLTSHLKVPQLVKGAVPSKIPIFHDNVSKQKKSQEISYLNVNYQQKEEQTVTCNNGVNSKSSHNSKIDEEFENCTIENFVGTASTVFSKICRTCFAHSEMVSISEFSWEGVRLQEVIKNWTTLKINEIDKLPKQMCTKCVTQMYKTYNFLVKCKRTESVLNRILKMEAIRNAMILVKEVPTDSPETYINTTENIDDDNEAQYPNSNISNDSSEAFCTINYMIETDVDDQEVQNYANSETDLINEIESIKNEYNTILANPTSAKESEDEDEQISNPEFIMIKSDHSKVKGNVERVQVSKKKYPINSCIPCDRSFVSAEKLRSHLYMKHRKDNMFVCPYCEKKAKFPVYYIQHVRYHTGEIVKSCSVCGKGFCSELDLNRHLRVHYDIKPYVCKICKQGFRRCHTLSDHMRTHTGEKRICPICGASFLSYASLHDHERSHKSGPTSRTYYKRDTKFLCSLCGKVYRQKSGLKVHMKSHDGLNNYPCELCDKRFTCKSSLYQHNRIHTGDTKYQCKECLHIFTNKRHLENHLRVHSGEKPFTCEYCGKQFAQKANMQAHTKIHTGEKNFLCKVCGKGFYDGRGLRKHMPLHEKQTESNIC